MTPLRWLLSAGILGAGLVAAKQDALFTSAVTYCAPPENVLVQELDIRYYKHNSSVVFDVTASSLVDNLRVALALNLTVYGNQPLSLDLNLCDLASAVCPLPLYNFSGQGTLPIPSSFSSKIPSIGYTVPDLEAFAQLELRRVDTGEVAACVSATLSNGWSMKQPGATWAAVGVVLFSIVLSVLWAGSKAKWTGLETGLWAEKELWRVVDVITFIQMIGVSALLNLNYPSAYRAFSLNFPFALLLTGPIPSQSAIDHLRQRTGARLGDDALPTEEYVNRRLSPYNMQGFVSGAAALEPVVKTVHMGNNFGYSFTSLNSSALPVVKPLARRFSAPLSKRVFINPATVTASDALEGGVPVYVNGAGVATANAFLGLFFEWLVIAAVVLGVSLAYMLWKRSRRAQRTDKSQAHASRTSRMIHGMFLRLGLVLVLPVSIFAMYQWTLRDSWLATLLSVICILATWGGLAAVWIRFALASLHEPTSRFGALWPSLPMFTLYTLPVFVMALFVAFASRSGSAQAIGILVVEVLSLVAAGFLRWRANRHHRDALLNADLASSAVLPTPIIPPPSKTGITLRILRVVSIGLMIPFIESIGVKPIPRTVIGIVAAGVWGIGVVLAFSVLLWSLVKFVRRKRGVRIATEIKTESDENVKSPGPRQPPISHPLHNESERSLYYDARTGVSPTSTPTPARPLSQDSDYFTHAR